MALLPFTPTRRKMASSSASLRDSGPFLSSFSRGRSSSGHETIPFDSFLAPLGMGIRGDLFLEFAQPVGFFPVAHEDSFLAGDDACDRDHGAVLAATKADK